MRSDETYFAKFKRIDAVLSKKGSDMDIERMVKAIIADFFNMQVDDVKSEELLVNDIGADELDMLEIIMDIEVEFDIKIPEEDEAKFLKVCDVVECVKERVGDESNRN